MFSRFVFVGFRRCVFISRRGHDFITTIIIVLANASTKNDVTDFLKAADKLIVHCVAEICRASNKD